MVSEVLLHNELPLFWEVQKLWQDSVMEESCLHHGCPSLGKLLFPFSSIFASCLLEAEFILLGPPHLFVSGKPSQTYPEEHITKTFEVFLNQIKLTN